jgi:hypothetical protein
MSIINKFKKWWNPYAIREVPVVIYDYDFIPTENITAYELYKCDKLPLAIAFKTAKDFQLAIDNFYNNLPDKCKKYMHSVKRPGREIIFKY